MRSSDELVKDSFARRELTEAHRPMEEEFSFYEAVKRGDMDAVRRNCEDDEFSKAVGMGVLSKNPLQNIRYHFITTAALVTRFCVEGGMELERAYGLSDFYIAKMDCLTSERDIVALHHEMVLDFTQKMNAGRKNLSVSRPVRQSVDYIFLHLHSRLTLGELAENAGVSSGYLSKLFRRELGISVTDYIRAKKLESAQELLRYSDLSIVEIASYLAFASESYFVKVFHRHVGMTPKKYREEYFRQKESYIRKNTDR
ncbi:MAG: helix-turn-helix domain-containing protein [Clostridia bacterium]|nr:helix-turn-helix domain-containing protein [Clostridia bacterium]